MIPFDFEYCRPDSLSEAKDTFNEITASGKCPVYYGGGTELISMARAGSIGFDAVIDIKCIPECNVLCIEDNDLIIGSAVTLSRVAESGRYPLLGETVSRIADHTIQCKITMGGNIAGTIIYREAALPLMITNSRVKIMGETGLKEVPFLSVFNGTLKLKKGEFIVQFLIDKNELNMPYNHVKRTRIEKIGYPLLTLAAVKKDDNIHVAVSGLSAYPFLLPLDPLNEKSMSKEDRINNTVTALRNNIVGNLSGSGEYRIFVLKNVLNQTIHNLLGVQS